jgi:hypothetical protein
MRQPGRPHDIGNADAIKTILAEHYSGDIQDLLPVLGKFLAADAHGELQKSALDNLYDVHHQYARNMIAVI